MDRNTGDKEGTPWVLFCRWEDPPDLCASCTLKVQYLANSKLESVGFDDEGRVKGIIIFVWLD